MQQPHDDKQPPIVQCVRALSFVCVAPPELYYIYLYLCVSSRGHERRVWDLGCVSWVPSCLSFVLPTRGKRYLGENVEWSEPY